MRDWIYSLGAVVSVALIVGAAYWAGGIVQRYLYPHYVSLACVDAFTKQGFQTDHNVLTVEVRDAAYALNNRDGTLTLIPRTDNLVCSLSEEYLPDAPQPTP